MSDIQHVGTVTQITDQQIRVKIQRTAACGSCSAKKMCGMSESKEIIVDIERVTDDEFQVSDSVRVVSQSTTGRKAVFYGYVLPFLVLSLLIAGCLLFGVNEGISALCGLAGLGIYYGILYRFREKISAKFRFRLERE